MTTYNIHDVHANATIATVKGYTSVDEWIAKAIAERGLDWRIG